MGEGFTVMNILRRASVLFPENKVIAGKTLTYREIYENVSKISTSMNKMGISKGTVFAVADYNSMEFMDVDILETFSYSSRYVSVFSAITLFPGNRTDALETAESLIHVERQERSLKN